MVIESDESPICTACLNEMHGWCAGQDECPCACQTMFDLVAEQFGSK